MEIIGDASAKRVYAVVIDNIIAIIVGYVGLALIPVSMELGRILALVLGYLFYFFLLEGLWSRTIGKYYQGLIVRKLSGERAGWKEAAIRTAFRVIEINPLFFGALPAGLMVYFTERKQRLGDLVANTIVVSDKVSQ